MSSTAQQPKRPNVAVLLSAALVTVAVVGGVMFFLKDTITDSTTNSTSNAKPSTINTVTPSGNPLIAPNTVVEPNKFAQFTAQAREKIMANKAITAAISSLVLLLIVGGIVAAVMLSMQQAEQVVPDVEEPNTVIEDPVVAPQTQAPEPTLWERYFALWVTLIVVGAIAAIAGAALLGYFVLLRFFAPTFEVKNKVGEDGIIKLKWQK